MTTSAPVSFDDLLAAFEWVSAAGPFENEAYVSRVTGKLHWSSSLNELDEELPEDIEDESIYLAVPHKTDLELGRDLVYRFVEDHLPEFFELVSGFFRKRGAYSRFKTLLERKGKLEAWYEYEASAVEQALRDWCADNEIPLTSQPRQDGR